MNLLEKPDVQLLTKSRLQLAFPSFICCKGSVPIQRLAVLIAIGAPMHKFILLNYKEFFGSSLDLRIGGAQGVTDNAVILMRIPRNEKACRIQVNPIKRERKHDTHAPQELL